MHYQIVVLDARCPQNILYKGPEKDKTVYLEYVDELDNGHFNTIVNIKGYMRYDYYCKHCHIGYSTKNKHMCKRNCSQCNTKDICTSDTHILCSDCNRVFYRQQCYNNHKDNNICEDKKCCPYCERVYTRYDHHQCEKYHCSKCCENYTEQPHYCYIKKLDKNKVIEDDQVKKIFVAFDIESIQIQTNKLFICPKCNEKVDISIHKECCPKCSLTHNIKPQYTHYPNLLISNTVCDECWDRDSLTKNIDNCTGCGLGRHEYFGLDCVQEFCNYLFTDLAKLAEEKGANIYAFAHNARGYDAQFILQDVWKRNFTDPDVIMQGRKILRLKAGNVNILDSLSFFLQPLSALPKAFGLNIDLVKGHFPHYFNKEENYNYEGPLPPIETYGIEYMKPDQAQKLREWYNQQVESGYVFNFKRDLVKYCKNDVAILIKSVMVFRQNIKDITGLDPYTTCFTLAALGLKIFRTNVLPNDKTVGITPVNGYSNKGNKSKASQCWLDWLQHETGKEIKREYNIGKLVADGCIESDKEVFEFFGCRYHGCPCYYQQNRDSKLVDFDKTPNELYCDTIDKLGYYSKLGYKTNHIWECQFKRIQVRIEKE